MIYQKVPIKDHPNYSIDTDGIVYGKNGNPLKPAVTGSGYLLVILCENGKTCGKLIHRLIAEHFIPNPENKPTVNHIDGDKSHNYVENLEWATYKEQSVHYQTYLNNNEYDFSEDWEKFEDVVLVETKDKLIIFPSPRTVALWLWDYGNYDAYRTAYTRLWAALNTIKYGKKGIEKYRDSIYDQTQEPYDYHGQCCIDVLDEVLNRLHCFTSSEAVEVWIKEINGGS